MPRMDDDVAAAQTETLATGARSAPPMFLWLPSAEIINMHNIARITYCGPSEPLTLTDLQGNTFTPDGDDDTAALEAYLNAFAWPPPLP